MSPSAIRPPTPPGTTKKINLIRIAHVYYTHANISRQHSFLEDFGFTPIETLNPGQSDETIYYRGYGTEPFLYCLKKGEADAFGGAAFAVESTEDLDLATRVIPTASEVWEMKGAPGGGQCVTVRDPVDGFPLHLVYGQAQRVMEKGHEPRVFNFPTEKHRAVNKTQRMQKGPAQVHKLGHFGMCVTNFQKSLEFWTTYFNFKSSDILHNPTGDDITTFMHLDRGAELVDHHCFFFYEGPKSHIHHSSFEVFDFDTQVLGHDWLVKKGYENCWGVGRHILGSQIFDYWFDPSRFILEHYVDGDLVDGDTPVTRAPARPDGLYVWGPEVPSDFMD